MNPIRSGSNPTGRSASAASTPRACPRAPSAPAKTSAANWSKVPCGTRGSGRDRGPHRGDRTPAPETSAPGGLREAVGVRARSQRMALTSSRAEAARSPCWKASIASTATPARAAVSAVAKPVDPARVEAVVCDHDRQVASGIGRSRDRQHGKAHASRGPASMRPAASRRTMPMSIPEPSTMTRRVEGAGDHRADRAVHDRARAAGAGKGRRVDAGSVLGGGSRAARRSRTALSRRST